MGFFLLNNVRLSEVEALTPFVIMMKEDTSDSQISLNKELSLSIEINSTTSKSDILFL